MFGFNLWRATDENELVTALAAYVFCRANAQRRRVVILIRPRGHRVRARTLHAPRRRSLCRIALSLCAIGGSVAKKAAAA